MKRRKKSRWYVRIERRGGRGPQRYDTEGFRPEYRRLDEAIADVEVSRMCIKGNRGDNRVQAEQAYDAAISDAWQPFLAALDCAVGDLSARNVERLMCVLRDMLVNEELLRPLYGRKP